MKIDLWEAEHNEKVLKAVKAIKPLEIPAESNQY